MAIPYNSYEGELSTRNELTDELAQKSNQTLAKYWVYLEEKSISHPDILSLNLAQMKRDIEQGMYFDSSIPQGYGIGSSGALVAALYDKYANPKIQIQDKISQNQMQQLKEIFALMESFFHGQSSGLDPLNSYLSLPLLIISQNNIEPIEIPSSSQKGKGAVFLLDSQITGETAPMVQIFMEKMKKNKHFRRIFTNEFAQYTNDCIDDFLQGDFHSLVRNVRKLSKLVLAHFKPMIPEQFHGLWRKGIESGDYSLKLCGSGGGGYILGFTENWEKAQKSFDGHRTEVIYQF